jgi:hypothetical protein
LGSPAAPAHTHTPHSHTKCRLAVRRRPSVRAQHRILSACGTHQTVKGRLTCNSLMACSCNTFHKRESSLRARAETCNIDDFLITCWAPLAQERCPKPKYGVLAWCLQPRCCLFLAPPAAGCNFQTRKTAAPPSAGRGFCFWVWKSHPAVGLAKTNQNPMLRVSGAALAREASKMLREHRQCSKFPHARTPNELGTHMMFT